MKNVITVLLVFFLGAINAQILTPYQSINSQPKVQFDYWVYSTHAGNGSTTQYVSPPLNKSDMDKIFNTSNSNTTLFASGRTNSAKILDWTSISELSNIGISLPNNGTYFAMKIQGTFIPLESGIYIFTLQTDDASDFTLNGNSVTTLYSGQAIQPIGTNTGSISLTAGQRYTFEIRMQQGASGFGLRFYWKSPVQNAAPNNFTSVHPVSTYFESWTQNLQELVTSPDLDGSSSAKAAPNAKYIQTAFNNFSDNVYWINLPFVGPTQIYCLLNSAIDGGGWMLMMKATTGTEFQYSSSHWTTASTLSTSDNSRSNANAKFNTMNYYYAKDMMALWPDIPWNYGSSSTGGSVNTNGSYNQWTWLQKNFNNGTRITPIDFFSKANNLFFGDANNFAGKGTAFSGQTQVRFYGFNYNVFSAKSVRWGFGWNENAAGLYPDGDQGSNDVSGGIGMSFGNYSAGDAIGCCQNTTGVNTNRRVEVYIR
jgi:hypothetical protein